MPNNQNGDIEIEQGRNRLIIGAGSPDLMMALREVSFSASTYLKDHADLDAELSDEAAAQHFISYGYREDRLTQSDILLAEQTRKLDYLMAHPGHPADLAKALVMGEIRRRNATLLAWPNVDAAIVTAIRSVGIDPYIVVGDSHSRLYIHYDSPERSDIAPLHLLCSGGSAAGLNNLASRSQYGVQIKAWAEASAETINEFKVPVFLKFGQVDAEFVSIFKRIREGIKSFSVGDFEDFSTLCTNEYFEFVDEFIKIVDPSLIRICSIFPPTLSDAAWAEGYVNAHVGFLEGDRDLDTLANDIKSLDVGDIRTRTSLHAIFNADLQKHSARRNLAFLNDFAPLVGSSGVVEGVFMHDHPGNDHHLRFEAIRDVVAQQITRFLHTAASA